MRYDDENDITDDDPENGDEFEGYAVLDDEGNELDRTSRGPAEFAPADSDMPEGSVIGAEHIVAVHKPCAGLLSTAPGTVLELEFLGGDTAYLSGENGRMGLLDPAFVKRLIDARSEIDRALHERGEEAAEFALQCTLEAVTPAVTVRVRYSRKKKKEKNWDDGEIPEASALPENEQTVIIDNAAVSYLDAGAPLRLVISGETAQVFDGGEKVGDLKPAFVKKLLETRKGSHVACELFSAEYPAAVRLRFYARASKNTVKI